MTEGEFQEVLQQGGDATTISEHGFSSLTLREWADARSCWLEIIHANTEERTPRELSAYAELQSVSASHGSRDAAARALWTCIATGKTDTLTVVCPPRGQVGEWVTVEGALRVVVPAGIGRCLSLPFLV